MCLCSERVPLLFGSPASLYLLWLCESKVESARALEASPAPLQGSAPQAGTLQACVSGVCIPKVVPWDLGGP